MTVLTWEPRRLRLILVKAAAAVILAVAFTLAMQAVLSLLLWVVASTRGITEGADAAWFRGVVGVLLRGLLLSAVFAGVGFSVGSLGRNTAAALGAGFGYLIVLEQILAGVVEWIRPWLIIGNTAVLLSGHSLGEIAGRTPFEAGLILSLYGAGLVAIATAVFRRRDVAA